MPKPKQDDGVKPKRGRKQFAATAERRRAVAMGASNGISLRVLAMQLGCCEDTIKKRFATEWEYGFEVIKSRVTAALTRKALQGDVGACRLWLTSRCIEWRPVTANLLGGFDGAPPIPFGPSEYTIVILPDNGRDRPDVTPEDEVLDA